MGRASCTVSHEYGSHFLALPTVILMSQQLNESKKFVRNACVALKCTKNCTTRNLNASKYHFSRQQHVVDESTRSHLELIWRQAEKTA